MKELEVLGVRVELPTNQPIVLLREIGGRRCLPIWIGAAEASAIAYAQQGVVPPRPLTHDLMVNLLGDLGHRLTRVRITALHEGAFHARLDVSSPAGAVAEVDSRSSDAIALALRTGAPIMASEQLLDEAGIEFDDDLSEGESLEATGSAGSAAGSEDVLAEFKHFLDQVSADDFGAPGNPGEEAGGKDQ